MIKVIRLVPTPTAPVIPPGFGHAAPNASRALPTRPERHSPVVAYGLADLSYPCSVGDFVPVLPAHQPSSQARETGRENRGGRRT